MFSIGIVTFSVRLQLLPCLSLELDICCGDSPPFSVTLKCFNTSRVEELKDRSMPAAFVAASIARV